jgi:acyl dehydratase
MNLDALKVFEIPAKDHDYTVNDTMLYALGLGYGSDPLDEAQVGFVYEDGLKVVPSMCNTIAHPGFWINKPELGIDWVKVLHGEQSFQMHRPLPAEGKVRGTYRIVSIEDKGPEKGAIMTLEKTLTDRETAVVYFTVIQTIFMRGDGGQGGFGTAAPTPSAIADRAPDLIVDVATMPQIALIYRLSGDYNPIHASPAIARKAGFERPILHGLCTMGLATRALVDSVCSGAPERLSSMYVRFSKPVFPGETIRTEVFTGTDRVRFRCRSVERDVVVLDRGVAVIAN